MLRMRRSIQVEGAFGLMKHDFGFRRFFSTGKRNIRTGVILSGDGIQPKKAVDEIEQKARKRRIYPQSKQRKLRKMQNI